MGRSDAEGKRLGSFARVPLGGALERLDRARLVDVDHRVELVLQPDVEVMALALRFGTVDDADRSLEPRRCKRLYPARPHRHQETLLSDLMEELFDAAGQRRTDVFAFRGPAPVARSCDGSAVRREPDRYRVVGMRLTEELTDVDLTLGAELGGSRISDVGVVRPHHDLRVLRAPPAEMRGQ